MVARFVMKSNKKQIISILAILTMAILLSCAFVACDKVDTDKTGTDIVADYKVTIHPNNGQGDIVWDITKEIPTITKDGYHIAGYFLDAQLTISTTLESLKATGITKNIDVYVKWEEDVCEHVAVTDAAVAPTCTEKGRTEGKHCSKCGKILQAQTEILALGHDLEHHDGQEATCTEKGWKAYVTCKRDGCTYTTYQEIPALGHTEVVDDAIAPTCTEKGKTEGKHCSVCNTIIVAQTDIAALGHDLEHHNKKEATCTEKGWDEYDTCKREGCGYTTYQEIPALGHKYSQEWSNDKTYHWHASTCGHDVVSDKGKHTFDSNWVCTECAYVDAGLHGIELRTNTLELDGTDIFGKVSNATSTFSFINEIAIADSASYTVSTDINGSNVIRTKTVSFGIGDNTFYILVENGKDLGLYTVVIRRRPMYSVSFNVNGGTSVSAQTIEEDHFATEPTTERKGYTFDKWDYDFSKPIIKDTTITASWNIITYNVYYDLSVPSDSISQGVDNSMNVTTYTVEDAITFKTPSRKGYRFTGWDKNIEKGTIGDVTVTASWEVIEYDIVYDFGDADSVSKATNNTQNPSKYTIEDAITFVEPSRTGYTFISWDKNIVRGTIDTQTITASWEIIEYDIVYDFGDTDSVSKATNNAQNPSTYTIEDAIAFAEPSRDGYTFIAWDKSIASGTIGTQTITASWEIIEYSIIYDFGDTDSVSKATNNAQNPSKYTIENTITFSEPSRDGYTFIAWDKSIEKGTINTQTITAIWEVINYSITYELNGWENSSQNVDTYTIEDGIITLYDAIKGESLFCGWYLDEEYKNYIATIDASTMRDYMVYAYTDDSATKGLSVEKGSVKGYSGTLTDVVIPSYYKGNSVTNIKPSAFENCSGLTSITIGNGMMNIGKGAFSGCSELVNIYYAGDIAKWCGISGLGNIMLDSRTLYIGGNKVAGNLIIPDSVTSIGDYAFYGCTGLASITIPNSVTSIGYRAFYNCSSLTSITIPDSVTSIGNYAFEYCSALTSVTLGNSVTSIGKDAFKNCYKLVEVYNKSALSITAGSSDNGGVARYAKNVYTNEGGSKLTTDENGYVIYMDEYEMILVSYRGTNIELVLPSYITKINQNAFAGCSSLTSITIPDSVTSIDGSAFAGCSSLTSITIPDSVTSIDGSAFAGCTGLTSVTIPDSVTSIGVFAFRGCTGLTSITIPDSVTSIGASAFNGCTGLTSIIVNERNTNYHSAENCLIETATNTLILGCKTSVIPTDGSVTSIGESAFSGCSGLTNITIPDSVTSIGRYAFMNCTGLTSITIPNSVTSIGDDAFYDTTWYNNQPDGLVYVGKVAYKYKGTMPSNTSIVLKEGTLGIADFAFQGCSGLTSITIPDSVTSVGYAAFSGCTGLIKIIGPSDAVSAVAKQRDSKAIAEIVITSGTSISDCAFRDCTSLTTVTIPDSVTSIDGSAFSGCTGLTSITIPDSVTSIGFAAFFGCTGLTSVTIGNSVMSIGSSAFWGCSGLTSITIPNSVTSIGSSAFYNCTRLASISGSATNVGTVAKQAEPTSFTVNITSGTSIGDHAFSNCTGLTSVTMGNSVTSIRGGAFYGCTGLTSITIPDSVTHIDDYAFQGCTGLTSITIPDSVTSIGESAFDNTAWYNNQPNGLVYAGKVAYKYKGTMPSNTSIVLKEGTLSITDSAFRDCTGLTSVTIGNSVTKIGDSAFYNCTGLTSIAFNGTIAQWNDIYKGYDWKLNVPATQVVCKDGTVSI